MSRAKRMIIREYEAFLKRDDADRLNAARYVASRLGYQLDENNSSSFVLSVIREHKLARSA